MSDTDISAVIDALRLGMQAAIDLARDAEERGDYFEAERLRGKALGFKDALVVLAARYGESRRVG